MERNVYRHSITSIVMNIANETVTISFIVFSSSSDLTDFVYLNLSSRLAGSVLVITYVINFGSSMSLRIFEGTYPIYLIAFQSRIMI